AEVAVRILGGVPPASIKTPPLGLGTPLYDGGSCGDGISAKRAFRPVASCNFVSQACGKSIVGRLLPPLPHGCCWPRSAPCCLSNVTVAVTRSCNPAAGSCERRRRLYIARCAYARAPRARFAESPQRPGLHIAGGIPDRAWGHSNQRQGRQSWG